MKLDPHHYERAFEEFLRRNRIPYVSVHEARKALIHGPARQGPTEQASHAPPADPLALKNFDFVVYRPRVNLLVDVKGRRLAESRSGGSRRTPIRSRLQNWVTREDIDALRAWQNLFGEGFRAAFVFAYWCPSQPPDGAFHHVFQHRSRWYALRSVELDSYARGMKERSPCWATVDVPARRFDMLGEALCPC